MYFYNAFVQSLYQNLLPHLNSVDKFQRLRPKFTLLRRLREIRNFILSNYFNTRINSVLFFYLFICLWNICGSKSMRKCSTEMLYVCVMHCNI